MTRVLRIINRFNLGGPTHNAAILTKGLEPDFETLLIGAKNEPNEGSSLSITSEMGIDPVIIENMQRNIDPGKDFKAYREILDIVKEFKPDIVHTHASKAGLLGRMAAKNCKVPIVVHTYHGHVFHSYFGKAKTSFYKLLEKRMANKSDSIIAISESQKMELSEIHGICDQKKIKVIPLGFQLDKFAEDQIVKRNKFRKEYEFDDNTVVVGIVGRLVPIKNHSMFIQLISKLKNHSDYKIKAMIIGDGETRQEIIKKAKNARLKIGEGIDNDVILTSWLLNMDIVMSGLDIVALTSLNEGTPVSLIEAMASGKPVISTNVGGIPDVVSHNENGFLHDVGDLDGMTKSCIKLISEEKLRIQMGESGKIKAFENYHSNRLLNDMKTHYNSLLKLKNLL